jgi:nucleoside-diphosphate-sugar epimerase
MSHYLVLGGSGFIGANLVQYLLLKGHKVKNIDILDDQRQDLRYIQILNLANFDGCFFLAWDVGGSKYLSDQDTWKNQYKNNIALMHNVIPQIEKSKVPTLFVSTQLAGIDHSPYSLTKLIAQEWSLRLGNLVVARQWNAYGSIEKYSNRSHVISDFFTQAINRQKIELLTNGLERRQFVHMIDICDAYMNLIDNHLGSVYDVTSEQYISIIDIAKKISHLTGAKLVIGNVHGVQPQNTTIVRVPQWTPKIDIDTGLQLMYEKILQK